jgi:hypothetical protein
MTGNLPMPDRERVLLTVLIDTANRRWFVAGITQRGEPVPLMCSAAGNLDPYRGVALDEQVSFLRHRLSGVLQRGCDRLWGRQMKPRQIIFVVDGDFDPANSELTRRVADHFVLWMTNPPVAFFISESGWCGSQVPTLTQLAGHLDPADQQLLATGLPRLIAALDDPAQWELAATNRTG